MASILALACVLLWSAGTMLSACPVPQFEIEPNGLVIDEALVTPPLGLVTASRQCAASTVSFDISAAVDDPEGDRVFVFWYVNYDPDLGGIFQGNGDPSVAFPFDVCLEPAAQTDDTVLIEAVIMDRPPVRLDGPGARQTTEDGNVRILYWVVEIAEGDACCGG
ncbi:MAG: hypothetical protein H6744_06925 [Deltaproteobacteria bacterium]|nr:hypothetical protein [Deltaproteobacteria bacterium]MCB9786413.1 hypothetical protein [Deltaproteobacteria bacterium]